ncbi:hypothetical protein GOV11_01310, partial [Candidatus Woesearchaeota archaeon]|nr:hypothetical protein [Candidatus Woesearchaeota archaeon]
MKEEFEWEEIADMAVANLTEFIHTERHFFEEEHILEDKLESLDNILVHLDERIPENMHHLHTLLGKVYDKLREILGLLESDRLSGVRIENEDSEVLTKLKKDI